MSNRTAQIITVIVLILINLYFMTSGRHGGRGQDYYEQQTEHEELSP